MKLLLIIAVCVAVSVVDSMPENSSREAARQRFLEKLQNGRGKMPQLSLYQCISEPPADGPLANLPPEMRDKLRQRMADGMMKDDRRTAYIVVDDAEATDCKEYLGGEVVLGNPIRDLCQAADADTQVRVCFVPPPLLMKKQLATGLDDSDDTRRRLTDEDLLAIPRTTEYFKGVCVKCPTIEEANLE